MPGPPLPALFFFFSAALRPARAFCLPCLPTAAATAAADVAGPEAALGEEMEEEEVMAVGACELISGIPCRLKQGDARKSKR